MKTYCEAFDHWLYHPEDTGLICQNRARRLPCCRRCLGVKAQEVPAEPEPPKESPKGAIISGIDKDKWIDAVRKLKEEYEIREGTKRDETSAQRIAVLVGELYLSMARGKVGLTKLLLNATMLEKDAFDLAMKYRLRCDPLEGESKRRDRKMLLSTWGVDKASGMEGYTSQLKEWTAQALLEKPETSNKEEFYGRQNTEDELRGSPDLRTGGLEDPGLEEVGIGQA